MTTATGALPALSFLQHLTMCHVQTCVTKERTQRMSARALQQQLALLFQNLQPATHLCLQTLAAEPLLNVPTTLPQTKARSERAMRASHVKLQRLRVLEPSQTGKIETPDPSNVPKVQPLRPGDVGRSKSAMPRSPHQLSWPRLPPHAHLARFAESRKSQQPFLFEMVRPQWI